ncbi:hypothetical protein NW762_004265 [Fusarium torreyae]|uniref:Uncharacterized protein n=1 Tax=Fusarium torreyae TaxID=1237075 RepID=A0A9W8S800_9HYPO|nr:hypothetical protein NW762_004265 [Fusarium torreyae]
MVRLRSMGKTYGQFSEPDPSAQLRKNGRRRHSPRSSVPVPNIEEDINGSTKDKRRQSSLQTILPDQSSLSQNRITRSNKGSAPLAKLPTPVPRKRRSTIAAPEENPSKRQRDSDSEPAEDEKEPQQSNQDAPGADFFATVNMSLGAHSQYNKLPELRPDDSAQNPAEKGARAVSALTLTHDVDEDMEDPEDDDVSQRYETSRAAAEGPEENQVAHEVEPDTLPEQPEAAEQEEPEEDHTVPGQLEVAEQEEPPSEQPASQPKVSQKNTRRSSQRKKRRQSKKATYGEPDYRARPPSPILGSDVPQTQATQPSRQEVSQGEKDPYNIESDQEQQTQPVLGKAKAKPHSSLVELSQENSQAEPQTHREQKEKDDKEEEEKKKKRRRRKEEQRSPKATQATQVAENRDDPEDDQYDNSSDDEPAAEEELDVSHIADDSLLLEAPPENSPTGEPILTTTIKRKQVQRLVHLMTMSGWTGKRRWEQTIRDRAQVEKEWQDDEPNSCVLSRIILVELFELYNLCKEIPRTPRFEEQLAYLREHANKFSNSISTLRQRIDQFISNINSIIEKDDPEQRRPGYLSVTKLYKRIIPMLVLLLDQSFQAGCEGEPQGTLRASNQKGEFTVYLLEPLERAAGWAQRLSQVMESWFELHPPRKESENNNKVMEHRNQFSADIKKLRQVLEKAKEDISILRRAPEERKKAMRRDEAARKRREADAQKRQEKEDLQMSRFIRSMQKVPSSQSQVRRKPSYQRVGTSHSATSRSELMPSQDPSAESYFEKHGWHYWEDDQLLSLIRTTSHPNYDVFSEMLPERDPTEVQERASHLRTIMRDRYKRMGISPPGWCTEQDWY